MRQSFLTFVTLSLLGSAVAFEYRVGVGKNEVTGENGLGFDPSSIHPVAGDTVVFEFHAGVHSAIQSSFATPCTPLSGGFSSEVVTLPNNTAVDATGLPTATWTVPDASSYWFFDQAGGLCHAGAVLSINPGVIAGQTAAVFIENAARDPGGSNTGTTSQPSNNPSGSGNNPSPSQTPNSAHVSRGGEFGLGCLLAVFTSLAMTYVSL